MIVIAGKYKGRKLKTLPGSNTRPTSARVKEDIFNILNNYFIFTKKTSLDLFGGSGALSIEGLSRGIQKAYINDHFLPALDVIKTNLRDIDSTSYQLWNLDYKMVMQLMKRQGISVDLIYFDPPFAESSYYEIFFANVLKDGLLNPWGIIVTESPVPLDIAKIEQTGLTLLRYKDFKNKHFYLWRREDQLQTNISLKPIKGEQ
ncbi:16S rRNA (guanine(966)-N(2))-methyltransferase RsmD [Entomoplasma freundtii]|uniref:16S rRNA (Guanine966-N2)-methyltransferase n=1 Tax=Entomoplasma freundtii TaxID=74700 RepID=A0A2K8NR00_9MOLU|nr:RsmD family RNA methyltransferase [Entomoplasma freundtii]ATZ16270.1 16S rRNA (guanine966-N2)-methyltransferase [Entomoplasma freundtii]TDY56829.1 16S rRNA (guanine(966)-N(2))-methyltransferase RsmD [Entomoplasma freundtii]